MIFPAAAALLLIVLPWRYVLMILGVIGAVAALAIFVAMPRFNDAHVSSRKDDHARRAVGAVKPSAFSLLLSVGVIDSATRMAFLTFLPFVLTAKGASVQLVGLALTLVFVGGAMGKLVCAFLGARIGAVATVWLTETVTAVGIVALLPLSLERSLDIVADCWSCAQRHVFGAVWIGARSCRAGLAPARFQYLLYGDYRRRRRFAGNLWVAGRCGRRPGGTHGRCRRRADYPADHACLAAGPCGAAS